MRFVPTLSLCLLLSATAPAWATVYKCVDSEGRITYTNDRTLARGCTQLTNDQAVSSVPAPPRRSTTTPATPNTKPSAPATSNGFPRIQPETQRARDDSRRQILMAELQAEEEALAAARKELSEQESLRFGDERNYQRVLDRLQPYKDRVALHERNIEALRKEISNLR